MTYLFDEFLKKIKKKYKKIHGGKYKCKMYITILTQKNNCGNFVGLKFVNDGSWKKHNSHLFNYEMTARHI